MSLEFVNYRGDAVATTAPPQKAKRKEPPESFHNGWRVVGIPPGALEEARAEHARLTKAAQAQCTKLPKPWDEENWLMNFRKKPVRSKPYVVPGAAQECKAIAERAGWLRVEVIELKKDAKAA